MANYAHIQAYIEEIPTVSGQYRSRDFHHALSEPLHAAG